MLHAREDFKERWSENSDTRPPVRAREVAGPFGALHPVSPGPLSRLRRGHRHLNVRVSRFLASLRGVPTRMCLPECYRLRTEREAGTAPAVSGRPSPCSLEGKMAGRRLGRPLASPVPGGRGRPGQAPSRAENSEEPWGWRPGHLPEPQRDTPWKGGDGHQSLRVSSFYGCAVESLVLICSRPPGPEQGTRDSQVCGHSEPGGSEQPWSGSPRRPVLRPPRRATLGSRHRSRGGLRQSSRTSAFRPPAPPTVGSGIEF